MVEPIKLTSSITGKTPILVRRVKPLVNHYLLVCPTSVQHWKTAKSLSVGQPNLNLTTQDLTSFVAIAGTVNSSRSILDSFKVRAPLVNVIPINGLMNQPNSGVIYYYQIEDVSFAGEHQTLTTTKLKGLISAKNKLTTLWSGLKSQQD